MGDYQRCSVFKGGLRCRLDLHTGPHQFGDTPVKTTDVATDDDSPGRKFDVDKPRLGLLPPKALVEIATVLTHGAIKYDEFDWRKVENAHRRYIDAALRHIVAYMDGDKRDLESLRHHLAHAVCCLMFLLELDLEKQ